MYVAYLCTALYILYRMSGVCTYIYCMPRMNASIERQPLLTLFSIISFIPVYILELRTKTELSAYTNPYIYMLVIKSHLAWDIVI